MKYLKLFEAFVNSNGEITDKPEDAVDRLNNPKLHVLEMIVSRNPKYYEQVISNYKILYPNNSMLDDCIEFKKQFESYLNGTEQQAQMAKLVITGLDDFINYLNIKN